VRRRLLWAGALVGAGAVAGLVFLVIPSQRGGIPSAVHTESVQRVPRPKQVPLTAKDRAAIDELLDRFVPAAIARRDPLAARGYVTPSLRAQATLDEWRAGTIPVPPYEPAGTTFHGWRPFYSYAGLASVELTLEPRRAGDPVASFVVNVKRVGTRWLVDGIYEEGTHGGGGASTAAKPTGTTTATATRVIGGSHGRLGLVWLLVPISLLSLIVIVPIVVFTGQWLAYRRVRRRHRGELPRELPPLPRPRDPRLPRDG
jgi:hypothetical protein